MISTVNAVVAGHDSEEAAMRGAEEGRGAGVRW